MLCAVILFLGFSDEPLLFRPSKVVGNVKDSRLENFVSVEVRIQPIIHHFARKDDRHAVMNKGDCSLAARFGQSHLRESRWWLLLCADCQPDPVRQDPARKSASLVRCELSMQTILVRRRCEGEDDHP